jgi:hypothetical protein
MSASLGPHARQCPPSGGAPSGGEFVPPAGFVSRSRELRCQGALISFNEPTLNLEWSLASTPFARIVVQYWRGEGSSGCSTATSRPTASVLDVGRRSPA